MGWLSPSLFASKLEATIRGHGPSPGRRVFTFSKDIRSLRSKHQSFGWFTVEGPSPWLVVYSWRCFKYSWSIKGHLQLKDLHLDSCWNPRGESYTDTPPPIHATKKTGKKAFLLVFFFKRGMFTLIHTFDGSEIPRPTTWDVKKLANTGINYQTQLDSRISEPSTVESQEPTPSMPPPPGKKKV